MRAPRGGARTAILCMSEDAADPVGQRLTGIRQLPLVGVVTRHDVLGVNLVVVLRPHGCGFARDLWVELDTERATEGEKLRVLV